MYVKFRLGATEKQLDQFGIKGINQRKKPEPQTHTHYVYYAIRQKADGLHKIK